jgi:hypothetical protein
VASVCCRFRNCGVADDVRSCAPLLFCCQGTCKQAVCTARAFYKLGEDKLVPLICPTCQNIFAGSLKASMPTIAGYFAWGCFRYFWLGGACQLSPWRPVRLRFRCAQATPDTTLRPSVSARLRHA